MKQAKHPKIEHIAIIVLAIIVVVFIAAYVNFSRRFNLLAHELTMAHVFINEILLAQETADEEIQETEPQDQESQVEEQHEANYEDEEPADDTHYRVIQHVLDEAPERLRYFFDEEVVLNPPENFVILPNNRILISGQWECARWGIPYTLEAIFGFGIRDDEIRLNLLSFAPTEWDTWRTPCNSPNRHMWVRHHELETVPVRFYWMGGDWDETGYDVEYLSGVNFSEELAYFALQRLNRRIVDAWFVGRILYVNLHHGEPMAMSSGTFGEMVMYTTLVLSMASVPDIDALVILVDGQREAIIGGHGLPFRDIYLTAGLDIVSLRGW